MNDDFSWQPAGPRRRVFPILAALIVALSALAGFAIGNRYPLWQVVDAIERNGVVRQDGDRNGTTNAAAREATKTFPGQATQGSAAAEPLSRALSSAPLLLNPGTAVAAQIPGTPENDEAQQPTVRTRAATKTDGAPIRSARKEGRRVIVVVRRVGPPYDTKVLRGQIQGGRLVVDHRDRRGIIIR